MYYIDKFTSLSLSEIGKVLVVNRTPFTHASVIHGINKIKECVDFNKDMKKDKSKLDNIIFSIVKKLKLDKFKSFV